MNNKTFKIFLSQDLSIILDYKDLGQEMLNFCYFLIIYIKIHTHEVGKELMKGHWKEVV